MIKLILLALIIFALPSGLVVARYTYQRLQLSLEERRINLYERSTKSIFE